MMKFTCALSALALVGSTYATTFYPIPGFTTKVAQSPNGDWLGTSYYYNGWRTALIHAGRVLELSNNGSGMLLKDLTNEGSMLMGDSQTLAVVSNGSWRIAGVSGGNGFAYTAMFYSFSRARGGTNSIVLSENEGHYSPKVIGIDGDSKLLFRPEEGGDCIASAVSENGLFVGRTYGTNGPVTNWVFDGKTRTLLATMPEPYQLEAYEISPNGRFAAGTCTRTDGAWSRGVVLWDTARGGTIISFLTAQEIGFASDYNVVGVTNAGAVAVTSGQLGGLLTGPFLHVPDVSVPFEVAGVNASGKLFGTLSRAGKYFVWTE